MSSRRTFTSLVTATASVLLLLTGCSTPASVQGGGVARKIYSSAEALAKDSSVIVRGRLGDTKARAEDDGGGGEISIPTVLHKFSVSTGSAAGDALPTALTLAWLDTDKVTVDPDDARPLTAGQEYVFFLEKIAEEQRGGLQGFGVIYVPVSSNAGVFSIENGKAVAADEEITRVKIDDATQARVEGRMAVEPDVLLSLTPGKAT